MSKASLKDFFEPRGIAIIGASAKPGAPNNQIVKFAIEESRGHDIQIYPINPRTEEIEGLKAYRSILDIEGDVDLILMAVSSKMAMSVAEEVKKRREQRGDAGAVAIITAGFKEQGTEEGERLQNEMIAVMTVAGSRVIGPNCQGVIDVHNGVNTTFSVTPGALKGGVSIVSQSGAFVAAFLRWAKKQDMVAMNKLITLGNMADVDVTEMVEYLADDPQTKSISVYLEGTPNARKFIETAKKVTKKKPVVVIKAGRSEMGKNVAHSHTASVAGNDAIYDGAFRQAGILRAYSVDEFYHTGRVFDKMPVPKGDRVAILTVVGGPSTICVDAMASRGQIRLAHFSEELKEKLRSVLSPFANVGSPDGYVDMTASVTPQMHKECIQYLMEDDSIDAILFITTPPGFMDETEFANALMEGYRSVDESKRKPLLSVLLAGNASPVCRNILEINNFPTFEFPDTAAICLSNMVRYRKYLDQED